MFTLGQVEGGLGSLGADGIAVSAERARDKGWIIGSTVPVTFPSGDANFVVRAIYSDGTDWVGSEFVDLQGLRANGGDELDYRVYVAGDHAAIESAVTGYASAEVLDKDAFLESVNGEIDTILGLFYALLALAVVIALLGIANTLALSVFERTRELGLLRAVGMGRGQVRSAIRWESIIIAVFGATLGLAIGTFFGWAIVRAMSDQGIDTLDRAGRQPRSRCRHRRRGRRRGRAHARSAGREAGRARRTHDCVTAGGPNVPAVSTLPTGVDAAGTRASGGHAGSSSQPVRAMPSARSLLRRTSGVALGTTRGPMCRPAPRTIVARMFQIHDLNAHSVVQQRQHRHRSAAAAHRLVRDARPPERDKRRFAPFGRVRHAPQLALR